MNRLAHRPATLSVCVLLLGGALAAGCTKEYAEPGAIELPLLTGVSSPTDTTYTRWRVTARRNSYNGQDYDLFATGDPCRRDDYREFRPDTLLFWRPGTIVCPTAEPDTVQGRWDFDGATLTLRNDPELPRASYTIADLTPQQLVLTWKGNTLSGSELTETITLTAAGR